MPHIFNDESNEMRSPRDAHF